jgi:hypothetical protein
MILARLHEQIRRPGPANVCWLYGDSGTGKTTIASTLCDDLQKAGRLGASFFFSHLLRDCWDTKRIVPTIAYQLALFSNHFHSSLDEVLGEEPDISTYNMYTQFEKLVKRPLLEVKHTIPANTVIVIDGPGFMVRMLRNCATGLPVKFLVTSLPMSSIANMMGGVNMTPINRYYNPADIETYLLNELVDVSPSSEEIRQLAQRSDCLFAYAATIVRYICLDNVSANSRERLNALLEIISRQDINNAGRFHQFYTCILTAALEVRTLDTSGVNKIRLILDTVVCLKKPVSAKTLAYLVELDYETEVLTAMQILRPVLHFDQLTGIVSARDRLFIDYMRAAEDSGRFFCDAANHHRLLAKRCFELMRDLLRFNICDLNLSCIFDRDVPDLRNRIDEAIPAHLYYACRSWDYHMQRTENPGLILSLLTELLSCRLLFWLEVLNLKQRVEAGTSMLARAYQWLQVSERSHSNNKVRQYMIYRHAARLANFVSLFKTHRDFLQLSAPIQFLEVHLVSMSQFYPLGLEQLRCRHVTGRRCCGC